MLRKKSKLNFIVISLLFISFVISGSLHTHSHHEEHHSHADGTEYSHPESHDEDIHSYCIACLFSQNDKFGHQNLITTSAFLLESDVVSNNNELKYKNLLLSLSNSRAPPVIVFS